MSLINDALRRANQQKERASAPPEGSPMQPAHHPERTNVSFFGPMLLIFFLGVVLTCAAWFFWKGSVGTSTNAPVIEQSSRSVPQETSPVLSPPRPMSENAVPVVSVMEPASSVQQSNGVVSSTPKDVASVPAAIAPAAPALKLQGIFYRIAKPTAMISGKTVGVGERVEGARVLKINRSEVTLERDGETIVLILN